MEGQQRLFLESDSSLGGRIKAIDNRGGGKKYAIFVRTLLACFERLHATRTSDIVIYIIGRLPTLLGRVYCESSRTLAA